MNKQEQLFYKHDFFSEIIRRLPDNTVTLEVIENNQVAITSGKANFTVNGLDADSYPHLPVVESQDRIEVPAHILNKIVNETVFAVSRSTKSRQF